MPTYLRALCISLLTLPFSGLLFAGDIDERNMDRMTLCLVSIEVALNSNSDDNFHYYQGGLSKSKCESATDRYLGKYCRQYLPEGSSVIDYASLFTQVYVVPDVLNQSYSPFYNSSRRTTGSYDCDMGTYVDSERRQ